jgi:hypothetical protein
LSSNRFELKDFKNQHEDYDKEIFCGTCCFADFGDNPGLVVF